MQNPIFWQANWPVGQYCVFSFDGPVVRIKIISDHLPAAEAYARAERRSGRTVLTALRTPEGMTLVS